MATVTFLVLFLGVCIAIGGGKREAAGPGRGLPALDGRDPMALYEAWAADAARWAREVVPVAVPTRYLPVAHAAFGQRGYVLAEMSAGRGKLAGKTLAVFRAAV